LLHDVESFDKSALKPTDTVEKITLPATEGKTVECFSILSEMSASFPMTVLSDVPIVA
jgi:hypothetical protein